MLNPFAKTEKVPVTLADEETGREFTMEAAPDTPEFAAGVKKMVDTALATVKEKIGAANWDKYCTVMFSCSYGKGEGMAQCIDGNGAELLVLMGIVIHTIAEQEMATKKNVGGNQVVAAIIQKLTWYVNQLDHDTSGIIT